MIPSTAPEQQDEDGRKDSVATASTLETAPAAASSSLAILNPKPGAEFKQRASTPTEAHIEYIGMCMIEMLNARDWNNPLWHAHIADNFYTYTRAVHDITSREEYIARYRAFTELNPDHRWDVINLSADVNDKTGRATLWMMLKAIGQPNAVQGERVNVIHFRRKDDRWLAYSGMQITGIGVDF